MSSYGCCMSRDPPSPEGFPPRPLVSSKTAQTATSWSIGSHLSKPEDVAERQAVFEIDQSDTGEEKGRLEMKPSSSALNAVKLKLRKHLSRESAISRRRPHSTVGNSEEEVERRKELRLIRDRRIKKELSNERAYDDDAKSLSTLATGNSQYDVPGPITYQQNDDPIDLLDTFATPCLSKRRSEVCLYSQKPSESPSFIPRRHSLTTLNHQGFVAGNIPGWAVRKQSSIGTVSAAPILEPRRLSSIADPASRKTSWRLSFASDQRASQLRSLSQEHGLPPGLTGAATESVLDKPLRWFRGEAIRVSSLAVQKLPENTTSEECITAQAPLCPNAEDFGSIDGISESNLPSVPLHDMKISQRLASRCLHSYSSSPQLSSWGSHFNFRRRSHSSRASNYESKGHNRHYWHISSSSIAGYKHSTGWDISNDSVSSIPKSAENTIQSQFGNSRLNLASVIVQKRPGTSFQGPVSQYVPTNSFTNEESGSDAILGMALARQNRRRVLDESPLASETSSFHDREAELDVIKTRFPRLMERMYRRSPVQSKFKEDFGESQTLTNARTCADESDCSPLRIPRISRLISRSYDGASPLELQIPRIRQGFGYNFSDRSRSIVGAISPRARNPGATLLANSSLESSYPQEDGTEQIWVQALQRTQEEYALKAETDSMQTKGDRKDSPRSFLSIRSLSWKLTGKKKDSISNFKESESDGMLADGREFELEMLLRRQALQTETQQSKADQWADELQARELQAKAKTLAMDLEPSSAPVNIPSGSWARYPSHTRPERTESAGVSDKVTPKDFAIKAENEGVIEWMISDRKHYHHHHVKEQHHSLPTRVSNQIRASLYKLRTMKNTARSDAVHGRKSSVSVGGKLEYPELEMLAGEAIDIGDYEQVEMDTAAQMRIDERTARKVIFGDGSVDGKDDDTDKDIAVGETSQVSIADPRFYEDCIFLSMDDDNADDAKSMKSNVTVAVKGKKRTWSDGVRAPCFLMDSMAMRRSTIDFQKELEVTESVERHRAIKSAEEAWGAVST